MAIPVLNNYEYQYMEGGVLLNNSTSLPFIDVHNISGLSMPKIDAKTIEYDGRHGGYAYAQYVGMRTIIIDGVLYANSNTISATLDTLTTNFAPKEEDFPFFFKEPGIVQRYILCKPIACDYDVDNLRNYGASKIQIQLSAGDVTKYANKADVTMVPSAQYNFTNVGNLETYPEFTISGAYSSMSIVHIQSGNTVTIEYNTDNDDDTVIDYKTNRALINGDNASNYITSRGWAALEPNTVATFSISTVTANIMVNPGAEANFGAGYAVGSNWTGTQQSTEDKRSGAKSLRMVRKNKSATNGYCDVPTGVASIAAGRHMAWVWVKGTMPNVSISLMSGATTLLKITNVKVDKNKWTKYSLVFTTASTQTNPFFRITDVDQVAKKKLKNQKLFMDDFGFQSVSSGDVTAVASTKDGWL